MKDFFTWFAVIFFVHVSDGYEVVFYDVENFWNNTLYNADYAYFVHYFYDSKECVNIGKDGWLNSVRSLERRSRIQCVTLYSEENCEGNSVSVHQLVPGHRLIEVNFDKKLVSFRDCEPKKVRLELSARPTFYLRIFSHPNRDFTKPHEVFGVKASECRTLPESWRDRATSVTAVSDCFILFDDINCKGQKRYVFAASTNSKSDLPFRDLGRLEFNDITKSFKTCDLKFSPPCNNTQQCPKFLSDGSAEYKFWMYFFSITSPPEQRDFAQQVERSTSGFISWNFLLPSDWETTSPGHQYQEAISSQHNVLRALIRPYRSNFNLKNVKTLLNLANEVRQERSKQLEKFKPNYEDPNFAIISQMVAYWTSIKRTLNEIIVNRFLENTDARHEVTFYKDIQHRYEYKTYAFEDKCVNLDSEWVNKTSSLEAYDQCITLYSKSDCKGDFVNIHPLSRGHQFLGIVNFDDKTVSFKKCGLNIEVRLNERPTFYLLTKSNVNYNGVTGIFPIRSGECMPLATTWHKAITSVAPDDQCYILYASANCAATGQKIYLTSESSGAEDLGNQNFANATKSIGTCDLAFRGVCDSEPCPKFIEKGTTEYHFWMLYFTINMQSHRSRFVERVKNSKNGFISWDFLFPVNSTAKSLGNQYQDALENLQNTIRALRASRPGRWGFNLQNTETFLALASAVHNERTEQAKKFKKDEDWTNHNYVVMATMNYTWARIKSDLDVVVENWQSENTDDICGTIGSAKPETLVATSPLISDGTKAEYGDDPWHAAIYRKFAADESPVLICGASLISRSVLVSAAHCFYDEGLRRAMNKTNEYEIVVGKFTRDYKVQDAFQKTYSVKELIFGPKSYNPILTGTYGCDIILIVLEESITFDQHIRPVCLDWDGSIFASSSSNETAIGRVVGWGLTSKDTYDVPSASPYLLRADLPYISQKECVGKVQHLTTDNFCGGSENGPGVRRGDSGGGFVFKYQGRNYLRGIVSTRDKYSQSSVSAFTELSLYTSWIRNYV